MKKFMILVLLLVLTQLAVMSAAAGWTHYYWYLRTGERLPF